MEGVKEALEKVNGLTEGDIKEVLNLVERLIQRNKQPPESGWRAAKFSRPKDGEHDNPASETRRLSLDRYMDREKASDLESDEIKKKRRSNVKHSFSSTLIKTTKAQLKGMIKGLNTKDLEETTPQYLEHVLSMEFSVEDSNVDLISQLIASEIDYVDTLSTIVENWLIPLRNAAEGQSKQSVIASEHILSIFCNVELIHNVHKELLHDIRKHHLSVGKTFKKRIQYMTIYAQYVNNWNNAVRTLSKYNDSKALVAFKNSCDDMELSHLLCRPVVRVSYYKKKLKDICDNLEGNSENEEEVRDLKEAVEKLQALSEFFVQQHQDEQNSNKIQQISKMLLNYPDELAVEGRRFIRDGELNLNTNNGEKKQYHFWLFSDVLIYAERQININRVFKFKGQIDLKKAQIVTRSQRFSMAPNKFKRRQDAGSSMLQPQGTGRTQSKVAPIVRSRRTTKAYDIKNAIQIVTPEGMHSISALTFEERDAWTNDLSRVVDYFYSKRVFGIPLEEFEDIPPFIKQAISYFDETALKVEGLFRISSSSLQVDSYKNALDEGNAVDFTGQQPHIVCSLLKQFFRDLPEPLFTYQLWPELCSAMEEGEKLPQAERTEKLVKSVKEIVQKLPFHNSLLLKEVIKLLTKVASFSEFNKMNAHNIGIVLEPTLGRNKAPVRLQNLDTNALASMITKQNVGVVELMIENFDKIFDEEIKIRLDEDQDDESDEEESSNSAEAEPVKEESLPKEDTPALEVSVAESVSKEDTSALEVPVAESVNKECTPGVEVPVAKEENPP